MKYILIATILTTHIGFLTGQITPEKLKPLFTSLSEEKFEEAHKISKELLGEIGNGDSPIIGNVRYMNLFSGAVLVAEGKIKCKELKSIAEGFQGKMMMMAGHPTTIDTTQNIFKYNVLKREGGKIISTTKASNRDNSIVYIYENFKYDYDFDLAEYDHKDTRCRGTLKEVQFNKKKSKDWIIKIYLENAKIHKLGNGTK